MFAEAALAAVYVPGETADELVLAEATGGPAGRYGLSPRYRPGGRSPVALAFRSGRPLWLSARELADFPEGSQGAPEAPPHSLAALPLGADGPRRGCLVVVEPGGDGFGLGRRIVLELGADQVCARLEAPGERGAGRLLRDIHVGFFSLALDTARIDADAEMLALVGIDPGDFDGLVETLLGHAVPEDLPALMSILEPAHLTTPSRELEFRVRLAGGEQRWLRMRCTVLADAAGRPDRVVGVVADAAGLQPRADEVSRVQRLSAALAQSTTLREVGREVIAALRHPLLADRVALAELKGDRLLVITLDPAEPGSWPDLWRSQWRTEWPDAPTRALPTLRAAVREGRVVLWPAGTSLEPGLEGIGPGGLAVLPLPAEGRVVGVCLIGWDRPHVFGPEERSLLAATAGLAGQAVVRARAYDAEHELSTTLQRSLLPRHLPALAGGVAVARYLPATVGLEVGGDWYDVIPLSAGQVALVIGDVQGHSAGAATIMGQMRTAIRAYAVEGHPPDVVVSHANRLLVGMETDLFATCCYVVLDVEEGAAWFVRAGHLPPLLREPDGTVRQVEVEGGPPLGVLAEADFPMTTAGLAPGTVLALLTDGLVESSRLPLEDGMRQVSEVLAAADTSDAGRVADRLLGGGGPRDDDVALLLFRYDGMRVRPTRAAWSVWRLPDAVMHARRFADRTLRSWKVSEEADAVLLVVSELVTNALVHTAGEVRLDLTLTGQHLRVAVSDASPRTPVKPATMDWMATGGRGLILVEAMSDAWGSVPLSGGKQVWAEFALPSREKETAPGGSRTP